MANISHSVLTGSQLHEPKGADTAVNGTVYVANGAGSGTWQSVGTSAFTGMISDFVAPVAPAGWLELDGTTISTSTYSALYSVMTIQTSGTRLNGNATITSIPDTSTFKVGYYVFGTGLTSGTTILSVDSGTQITLSGNATSSGSGTFAISPWLLNTGTIKLPDVATAGRYRRSRTSTTAVGQIQASQNLAHSHTGALTTGNNSVDHTHTFSGVSGTNNTSLDHTHNAIQATSTRNDGTSVASLFAFATSSATGINNTSLAHTHNFSGTTATASASHTHAVTIPSDGGTEARPATLIVLTCVKT
jgi:hypothetical protein